MDSVIQQPLAQPVQQQATQPVVQGQPIQAQQVQVQPIQAQPIQAQSVQNTFTQEQVNSIVSNRVNEVNAKYNSKELELANVQAQLSQVSSELTKYKHAEVLRNNNVNPIFNDFIEYSVSKLAVNGKTYEQAVVEFLSSNPQYLQTTVSPSVAPQNVGEPMSQPVGNSNQVIQTVQPSIPATAPIQQPSGVSGFTGNTGFNLSTVQSIQGAISADDRAKQFLKSRNLMK